MSIKADHLKLTVQIVTGKCPVCGATTESAEDLDGLNCARSHDATAYEPQDASYETVEQSWAE